MVIDSMLFNDFEVFIWLGSITIVTVYNVTMVMLYIYITFGMQILFS